MQSQQPKLSRKRIVRLAIFALACLVIGAMVVRLSSTTQDMLQLLDKSTGWPTLAGAEPCSPFQVTEHYTVTTQLTTEEFVADFATRWRDQGWHVAVSSDRLRLKASKADTSGVDVNLRRSGQTILVAMAGQLTCK